MKRTDLSIVVPAKNEQQSLLLLYSELIEVLNKLKKDYEIIFVDDGSTDQTFAVLKKIHQRNKQVKVIRLRGNFGKSIALQTGFDLAQGKTIITLDADLQDNPKEVPAFLKALDQGYDLVSGWKKKRRDPIGKVWPSRLINLIARLVTGVPIHDINCGFKAYRREVIENLNLYGELYRFIPIFAAKQNFRVTEVVVDHRPRKYGQTKFGWDRGVKGLLDLMTVIFLTGFIQRPGHFFGTLGLLSFLIGFVIGLYIVYLRINTGSIQFRHPLLFLGMLLMIIGIQLISTGLLAEMITYSKQKFNYNSTIKEVLR